MIWSLRKNDNLINPQGTSLGHRINHVLPICEAEVAGHGGDRDVLVAVFVDEQREDEVGGGDKGLSHGRAEGLGTTVATRAGGEVLKRVG